MSIAGVLFDKDGTLLDFDATWNPVILNAAESLAQGQPDQVARLLEAGGFDLARQRCLPGSTLGAGNNREIAECWARALGREAEIESLYPRVSQLFAEVHSLAVAPLAPIMQSLKDMGLCLGVATSDSVAGAEKDLARHGVREYFDFVCGYDSGHGVKPEPGMLLGFCRHCDLAPEQVAMVGDNTHDLLMGRSAGAGRCVGVLTGNSAEADLAPHADVVLASIESLGAELALHK